MVDIIMADIIMEEHVWDLILGVIIVPVLTGIFTLLINFIKKHGPAYRMRKLLRLDYSRERYDLNCFTANTGQYDENELVTLGYVFEYIAVGELRVALKRLYKDVDVSVKMSPSDFKSLKSRDIKDNLILIGGPYHNCLTRELLFNNEKFPFSFDDNANLTYSDGDLKDVFSPATDDNNKYYEQDYALIVNIRNPKAPTKRIIALIGCRSIGCYGASCFIAGKLKTIKKYIKDDEYAIVIKCDGDEEDIINEPEFVKYYPLHLTETPKSK